MLHIQFQELNQLEDTIMFIFCDFSIFIWTTLIMNNKSLWFTNVISQNAMRYSSLLSSEFLCYQVRLNGQVYMQSMLYHWIQLHYAHFLFILDLSSKQLSFLVHCKGRIGGILDNYFVCCCWILWSKNCGNINKKISIIKGTHKIYLSNKKKNVYNI